MGKQQQHESSEEDRAKKAIGGVVLELIRRWGMMLMVGWLVAGKPGVEKAEETVSHKEFKTYVDSHQQWGDAVINRLDGHLGSIDSRMGRMEERLDRALDKKLASTWLPSGSTNAIARRP